MGLCHEAHLIMIWAEMSSELALLLLSMQLKLMQYQRFNVPEVLEFFNSSEGVFGLYNVSIILLIS